jgi:hypothetical protein
MRLRHGSRDGRWSCEGRVRFKSSRDGLVDGNVKAWIDLDIPKAFLSSRIPNLQPHNRIALIIHHALGKEGSSDCRCRASG